MATFLFLIAMCFVLGLAGGFFIGRIGLPERLRPATLLWISAFFVCLAIVLWRDGDPALTGEAARRNAPFAFVLYSIFMGLPWIGGTYAGRAVGRAVRGPGAGGRG